ncbi:Ty1/Copia family ribonuclease HI, partial [Methylobacterium haplocladii]|uniref:Ty1/Copia family ribonuclease HI n=1 Tax=Methylobacterium haplocladii TaxID=1176176 RepID=UPI0024E05DD6
NVVSRSSAELEYRGMAHRVCELLWIRNMLTYLGFQPKKAVQLTCDNKAAIDIAHNPVQHERMKHVEIDRLLFTEKIEAKIINVSFVKSEDHLTDVLCKAITSKIFHNSLSKLGINDIHAPT